VLQNPFASFEHEIQARKICVLGFQHINHAQGLKIVLESSEVAHTCIQRVLPRVPKRGVAKVMSQANCLCQRFIEPQRNSDRPANLRHLERMGKPCSIQIAFVINEHLCLVNETPKSCRVDDAIAIALILAAVG